MFATNRQWIRYKSPSYPDPNSFEFSRKKSTADVAPLFSEGSRCIDCPGEMLQGSQESTCRLGCKSPLRYPNRHRGVHLFGFVLQLHIAPRCPTNRHHGFFYKKSFCKRPPKYKRLQIAMLYEEGIYHETMRTFLGKTWRSHSFWK